MSNVQARSSEEIASSLREWFAGETLPGVVSAYLFGSHAEGRAHRESDVDVAVLLDWAAYPGSSERFDARVRLTSEVIGALHRNQVDLVVLNDVPPELGRKVVQDGVRVYVADAELDHAYVRDVQLRAADLDPWLRRMRRIALERILG
jgi:hypothetical protein